MVLLLGIAFFFYFVYTLNFALKFNKADTIYNPNQKMLHHLLIWLVPFIWINLLKSMDTPTPGSHYFKKKREENSSYESGAGMFDDWGNDSGGGFDSGGDGGGGDGGD